MKRELTINIANKDPIKAITKAAVQLTKELAQQTREHFKTNEHKVQEMLTKEWKS